MKFSGITKLITGAAIVAFSGIASAAENGAVLSRIQGTVLVNQGTTYVTAREGMKLNLGDQLMVMDGGKAVVDYADGCNFKMKDNAVLRITDQSACDIAAATDAVGPYYAQLGGTPPATPNPNVAAQNAWALGIGGVAALCIAECRSGQRSISGE